MAGSPKMISSLAELDGRYAAVFCDVWGVIHNGERSFPDAAALFAAISAGQIAAVLQDLPVNSDRATKDDTVKVVDTIPTGEQYGFVVAKENTDLQKQLNSGLAAVKEDGTFDDIYTSYFPNAGN